MKQQCYSINKLNGNDFPKKFPEFLMFSPSAVNPGPSLKDKPHIKTVFC